MTNTYTVYKSLMGTGGVYKSSNPMSAAKKAASRLFKKMDNSRSSGLKVIHFAMRETTRGSAKKVFKYVARRVELANPVVLNIKGKEVVYRYKIDIKSDGEAPPTSRELRDKETKVVKRKTATAKKTVRKPCAEGKVRNSVTKRCRNVVSSNKKKPCKTGKRRNPETKRCRKIAKKPTTKRCEKGKKRNPETKRCRKIRGGEGDEMVPAEMEHAEMEPGIEADMMGGYW